jgi:hypothetical protein
MLLVQLSEKTSIPIGFEVSSKDDLSVVQTFKVQIEHGMLTDVLDAIVLQDPVYTWRIRDGVVNVLPQECCRDQSFMSRDIMPLGRNYELEVADVSVVELLNGEKVAEVHREL